MFRLLIFVVLAAVALCPLVRADQVILKNGDSVTGNIISLEGGALTVESEFYGTTKIPAEAIEKITSDQPLHFLLRMVAQLQARS